MHARRRTHAHTHTVTPFPQSMPEPLSKEPKIEYKASGHMLNIVPSQEIHHEPI